jgi:hypothetical protein
MSRESALEAALQEIRAIQPAAMEMLRKGNYVFDRSPVKPPVTEADRWQELAFCLYTDLCQANLICRQALEEEGGQE